MISPHQASPPGLKGRASNLTRALAADFTLTKCYLLFRGGEYRLCFKQNFLVQTPDSDHICSHDPMVHGNEHREIAFGKVLTPPSIFDDPDRNGKYIASVISRYRY